jgi:hypothetical protein
VRADHARDRAQHRTRRREPAGRPPRARDSLGPRSARLLSGADHPGSGTARARAAAAGGRRCRRREPRDGLRPLWTAHVPCDPGVVARGAPRRSSSSTTATPI